MKKIFISLLTIAIMGISALEINAAPISKESQIKVDTDIVAAIQVTIPTTLDFGSSSRLDTAKGTLPITVNSNSTYKVDGRVDSGLSQGHSILANSIALTGNFQTIFNNQASGSTVLQVPMEYKLPKEGTTMGAHNSKIIFRVSPM